MILVTANPIGYTLHTFTVPAAVQEEAVCALSASGSVARSRPTRVACTLAVAPADAVHAVAGRRKVLDDRLDAPASASHTVVALRAVSGTRLATGTKESGRAGLAGSTVETCRADALSRGRTYSGAGTRW